MKELPTNVNPYQKTAVFDENTIPKGLLKKHNTKAGTWGKINVLEGQLKYVIEDNEEYTLTPENPGIVEPEVPHHIEAISSISFFVEFYK